jgi:hypothetical protein
MKTTNPRILRLMKARKVAEAKKTEASKKAVG